MMLLFLCEKLNYEKLNLSLEMNTGNVFIKIPFRAGS